MFTGRVTLEDMREERPAEYERLLREGRLDSVVTTPPSPNMLRFGRIVGFTAISLGVVMVALAIYALLVA